MSNNLTIRKSGNVIEISSGGLTAPDENIKRLIEPELRYTKIEHLYGDAAWRNSIDGRKNKIITTPKYLYRYDSVGRLICGAGFYNKIITIFKNNNIPFKFINKDPKRPRPDCYEHDIDVIHRHFKFREKQEECIQQIINNTCGLINAVTGFGKMVIIAMTCMLYPKAKFIVVTKKVSLARKLQMYLSHFFPNVGLVGDKEKSFGRITVYVCASLHHCPFDGDFLLCDEAHEIIADKSSKWLAKSFYTRNFAFSASPVGRMDGADIRMQSLFGDTIFHLTYPEAVKLNLVVPIRVEWTDVCLNFNPCKGMQSVKKERFGIWRNAYRNKLIADKARTFDETEQVQIIVKTIEHAIYLKQHLPEYTLVYGTLEKSDREEYIKNGLLSEFEPIMTPVRSEELRKDFEAGILKKVISTNIWAVGIDPVQLTALIRADASSGEIMDIQAPGRVSRTHKDSGKSVGIVCDFRDQFDPGFLSKAKKRFRHYQKTGWSQVVVPLPSDNK